jgi:hypothetical protein
MIAAAGAIEAVIENPLLPVLKLDACETEPSGNFRDPGFDHDPASPGPEILVKNLVPHPKVSMLLGAPLARRNALFLRETGIRADFLWKSFQEIDSSGTLSIIPQGSKNLQPSWTLPQIWVLLL